MLAKHPFSFHCGITHGVLGMSLLGDGAISKVCPPQSIQPPQSFLRFSASTRVASSTNEPVSASAPVPSSLPPSIRLSALWRGGRLPEPRATSVTPSSWTLFDILEFVRPLGQPTSHSHKVVALKAPPRPGDSCRRQSGPFLRKSNACGCSIVEGSGHLPFR